MSLLSVEKLKVDFNNEVIINNLSFTVEKGDFVSLIGPNGSGKSVLVKTLLGLLPYQGKIFWQPQIKIGYLPQGLTPLKVKDYPLTVLDFFLLKNNKFSLSQIKDALQLLTLPENILKKKIGHLSSGQFQRMLMSWLLIDQPDILILDEPLTGLDLKAGETLYSLLKELKEKKQQTIILVTHEFDIISRYSNKVICLTHHNFQCVGTPEEVLSKETLQKVFGQEIKIYQH